MFGKVDIKQEIEKQLMNLQRKNQNMRRKKKEIIINLKDRILQEKYNFIQFLCQKQEEMMILEDTY